MNRIKDLRKRKGISQLELAQLLGVTQQAVSGYEKNISQPDIDSLKMLSDYFNVSIDYILGESSIDIKFEDAASFISAMKKNLLENGYDFTEKSAKEISEIVVKTIDFVKSIRNI